MLQLPTEHLECRIEAKCYTNNATQTLKNSVSLCKCLFVNCHIYVVSQMFHKRDPLSVFLSNIIKQTAYGNTEWTLSIGSRSEPLTGWNGAPEMDDA